MALHGSKITPRHTARGIVVRDGRILLMERWRPGMHYFSIPGGGIENGENPKEATAREIHEETTVITKVRRKVLEMRDGDVTHEIFLCHYVSGEPHMPEHAPEKVHASESNRFKPAWVSISELPKLPFTYWQPLQLALIDGLKHGFGDEVIIVNAAQAR